MSFGAGTAAVSFGAGTAAVSFGAGTAAVSFGAGTAAVLFGAGTAAVLFRAGTAAVVVAGFASADSTVAAACVTSVDTTDSAAGVGLLIVGTKLDDPVPRAGSKPASARALYIATALSAAVTGSASIGSYTYISSHLMMQLSVLSKGASPLRSRSRSECGLGRHHLKVSIIIITVGHSFSSDTYI